VSESKAVAKVLASGYLFDAKAFETISSLPHDLDLDVVVERLLEQKAASTGEAKVITQEDVVKALPAGLLPEDEGTQVARSEEADLEVISDPTLAISPVEAFEGFGKLFKDRYARMSSIVRGRIDAKGTVPISSARNVPSGKKVKVAALLTNRVSRRSNVELLLDDPSGTVKVICQDDMVKAAKEAPLDGMVVVEVSRSRSGQLFAESVSLPDVPSRRPVASSHRVYAVLLSDLHIGSRMFLADDFQRFLQWLNGQLGDRDVVNRVKYLVVAGDIVDGVGVYPGQEFQLVEKDPRKQYEMAAELLKQVPSHIQIVVSPGNHDSVRQALPQPAVSPEVADALYQIENLRWVGDPAYVKLHGVLFLVFHGRSLDDVISTTPGLRYDQPADAMKLLLRARHLSPTYGKRTALSPETRDFMVVDPVPDVLHSGHVHTFGEQNYRGTLLVNSGTWQAQTQFQSNMGLEPTPSIVPIVDLSTLKAIRRNFGAGAFPSP
jgi:DNA polymerase II small subunit